MGIRVVDLSPKYIGAATRLFCEAVNEFRSKVSLLPAEAPSARSVEDKLGSIARENPAVCAVSGNRVLGYMAGLQVRSFKGPHAGYYVPEWAHGVAIDLGEDARRSLYDDLYTEIARNWQEQNSPVHAVSILASHEDDIQTFVWNGFGMQVVDAIREVRPLRAAGEHAGAGRRPPVTVLEATPADAGAIASLEWALSDTLSASPVFLYRGARDSADTFRTRLEGVGEKFWIARMADVPVGYVVARIGNDDCSDIVQAPDTVSIVGAYVVPNQRRGGIATALVDALVAWAAEEGHPRVAVDFESHNRDGRAFWLRYFTPVAFSLIRTADARLF